MRRKTLQDIAYGELQKKIGINWKRLRLQHGMSRNDLTAYGISYRTQSLIETGEKIKSTNLDFCQKLAKAYQMDVDDVIKELLQPIDDKTVRDAQKYAGKDYTLVDLFDLYPYNLIPAMKDKIASFDNIYKYHIDPTRFVEAMDQFLSEREKQIIDLRYRQGYTLEEIGQLFGRTRERIRAIESSALRKCRKYLKKYHLVSQDKLDRQIQKNLKLKAMNRKFFLENIRLRSLLSEKMDRKMGTMEINDDVFAIPLIDLNLSMRTYHALHRSGKETFGDLVGVSRKEFSKIRNVGNKGILEISQILQKYGFEMTI